MFNAQQNELLRRAAQGVIRYPIDEVSSAYAVRLTDVMVVCNTSGGGFTVTVPKANEYTGRFLYVLKKTGDGNTVTISGNGYNINGAASIAASAAYAFVILFSLGTEWVAKT